MTITVSVLFFIGLAVAFLMGAAIGAIGVSFCWFKSPRKRNWKTFVNRNGTKIFITGPRGTTHEYNMSTPGDPATATYVRSIG